MNPSPISSRMAVALRRSVYPLVALPTGVWSLLLSFAGRRDAAVSAQVSSLRRFLDVAIEPLVSRNLSTRLLLGLPANLAAFAIAAYVWLLLPMNWAYPLRSGEPETAWGGPTMGGA